LPITDDSDFVILTHCSKSSRRLKIGGDVNQPWFHSVSTTRRCTGYCGAAWYVH